MSYHLWKYFFDDDVEGLRHHLAKATYDRRGQGGVQAAGLKVGSPGHLATSPKTTSKSRKSTGNVPPPTGKGAVTLTRSGVNARDGYGRTLLHHAASSSGDKAIEFVRLLLEIPLLDLYAQDTESGWTALHRALYFGNIAAAQMLMLKDVQNATDYTTNVSHVNAGGLVKIKDHEGNSPFEVFGLTTASRDLQQSTTLSLDAAESISVQSIDMDDATAGKQREVVRNITTLDGDEVFAFGSNKNITLGLGDGDDRTYPERIHLKRPSYLLDRLFEDFKAQRRKETMNDDLVDSVADLQEFPTVISHKPMIIQDVVMSKLHTSILTKDPIANLHICGFGPGGRLGTGDENTRFSFVCVDSGGLGRRRVTSVALGQDHTVAVCSSGEVFTWGSNKYGQLGYELPEVSTQETPQQLTPRQIYGLIKKEQIIGAAASSIHSAIYTSSGLYTFGKNEGQLGLIDADARSLETQTIPRRIGVSILQYSVEAVVAIDRATAVLMENHEVVVFTHYAWTKLLFSLDSFGSSIASDAFFTRHKRQTKHICRLTSGGNTIAALTTYGEVFTVDVPRHAETVPSSKSTTNPAKARNALPTPSKVWSIRKSHMAATDVAVGQDGSIILCTAAGTVWKKEKRANIKSVHTAGGEAKTKDYKFVRVPNIFGAIAVRSNSFGAFTAVRKDSDVMRDQIVVGPPTLGQNVFDLLAFRDYGQVNDEIAEIPQPRFWAPATKGPSPALIKRALLMNPTSEDDFIHIGKRFEPLPDSHYDVWVTSNVTDVHLPVHSLVLKARSRILRRALATFTDSYYFSIPDVLAIEYGSDGQIKLSLNGADFLTVANFVLYLYTDTLADVWRFTSKALHLAPRYRAVRAEMMRIASALELTHCERAVRVMVEPVPCMIDDFDLAFHDSDLFSDADVVVDLADGEERYAHSIVLQSRCPFFAGLFHGHTGGMWMADRRKSGENETEAVRVDLKHVKAEIFELVLRHIYSDASNELFDSTTIRDLDEFIDLVIDVMATANELMLDRLARVCQQVIGQYVTPWNVCGLLNTIAESSEESFKLAALEYIGLNLEQMLEQKLLEELDEYLLEELDETVQSNQLAFMPIARSDQTLEFMLEQDPTLMGRLETNRRRRLDSMRLPSRYVAEVVRPSTAQRTASEGNDVWGKASTASRYGSNSTSPAASPAMRPSRSDDLPFEMDEDELPRPRSAKSPLISPALGPNPGRPSHSSLTRLSSSAQSRSEDDEAACLATTPRAVCTTANPLSKQSSSKAVPWGTPATPSSGLGLKDIMLQDSSTKISNLTQSLQNAAATSKQAPSKVSQKERKRQQHEQKLQTQMQAAAEAERTARKAEKIQTGSPASPWQKIDPKQSTPAQMNGQEPSTSTLRSQVIAPQAESKKVSRESKPTHPQPSGSISSPGMTGASAAPAPQIQSIRHTPAPARSSSWVDARTSMADILAQQQFEKISVKENSSKRSLQDIQQEQAFQEWWDKESRRVQEEEAAAARRATGGAARRGGSKRRGPGQGEIKTGREDSSRSDPPRDGIAQEPAHMNSSSLPREAKHRSRGSHRGRGRSWGDGATPQA